ncbi:MAG: surface protein, partial [Flavipsychrobacter sp.]|nr:surface protein [Flavipsychrobacter sp.]
NTAVATIGSSTGIVTGVSTGTSTISYTITNGCGTAAATTIVTVSATPNAGTITGTATVCPGNTTTLSNATSGGIWTSVNIAVATIGSSTGIITAVATGTTTISYTVTNGCGTAAATRVATVSPLPNAGTISGAAAVCPGSSITLTNSVSGGTWSSSNANATVSAGGVVTGVTAGSNTISYTVTNSCGTTVTTKPLTISPLPNAGSISGASVVCAGSSITLTNSVSGGTWSNSNANATVSAGGVVTGVTAGANTISYTVTNSCGTTVTTKPLTISPLPNAGSIFGASVVCAGSSITLTNSVSGGTWSSSNANATVSAGGVVTGVTAGANTITYTVTNSCGTAITTQPLTISPLPNAGNIIGASSVCVGSSITLSGVVAGGSWSSSNANATVFGGVVTGVAAGTNMISYAVTNSCGTDVTTKTITVNPLPNAGSISGASGVCLGAAILLTNAITGGTWSSSNNAIATVSDGIVTGVASGTITISYAVTNMCGTDIAIKAITTNLLPLVPVISTQSPLTVCVGTMYQNFGAATQPPVNVTYKWTAVKAAIWAQGATHQYALVNFNTTGIAYVTLNAVATGTACANKSTIAINVGTNAAHIAEVSYFNSHFVCTPASEDSYQWGYDNAVTLDSTILNGEINQDYLNTSPDFFNKHYWVMTRLGDCLQKTYYHTPTAIQNIDNANSITVYPNPASDIVNIVISSSVHSNVQINVLNMLGQTITTAETTNGTVTIGIASLPVGSYLVACYQNGIKIATSRFIKN